MVDIRKPLIGAYVWDGIPTFSRFQVVIQRSKEWPGPKALVCACRARLRDGTPTKPASQWGYSSALESHFNYCPPGDAETLYISPQWDAEGPLARVEVQILGWQPRLLTSTHVAGQVALLAHHESGAEELFLLRGIDD